MIDALLIPEHRHIGSPYSPDDLYDVSSKCQLDSYEQGIVCAMLVHKLRCTVVIMAWITNSMVSFKGKGRAADKVSGSHGLPGVRVRCIETSQCCLDFSLYNPSPAYGERVVGYISNFGHLRPFQ